MSESSTNGPSLRILRLTSVFEPPVPPDGVLVAGFDPIGGMQNHTASLSRCLAESGAYQTVVTSRLDGPRDVQRLPRTEIVRTGWSIRRLRQLWALAALPRVLRGRYDVVHAHQGEDIATLVLARIAARVHHCPLVVTLHCSVRHTLRGRSPRVLLLRTVGALVETAALRRADAVITLTRRTADFVAATGVSPDRLHVIPSGIEPALFDQALLDQVDALPGVGRPRVGYVGRIAAQKRVDWLVRAFEHVRRPAVLVVVGDGPQGHALEHLIAQSTAADRIATLGFRPHAEIPAVLASLDLIVLPSAYEELGSVLLEAMAAGVPIVASRVGGIPEVVVDGESGLLVPPGDISALAAAIERILGDEDLRHRLGERGRERSRRYAWPNLAADVAELYRAAVGSARDSAGASH